MDDLLRLTSSWWCCKCALSTKNEHGCAIMEEANCPSHHVDVPPLFMMTLKPGFNLAWYVSICLFQECFILAYLAPLHLKLAAENDLFEEEIWNLGLIMFRIDMTRRGWKTYIYIYIQVCINVFVYILYRVQFSYRYPSISIYTKVCGHPNVCKHSAQIWTLCDRGELRCGTTDLGKSKKSLY